MTHMASSVIATKPQTPLTSFSAGELKEQVHTEAERNGWLQDWIKRVRRDGPNTQGNAHRQFDTPPQTPQAAQRLGLSHRWSKKVGVGLPRSTTFKRQQDESRQNLEPVARSALDRRQRSLARLRALSASPKKTRTQQVRREISAPHLGFHAERLPSIDARIDSSRLRASRQDFNQPPPTPPPQDEDENEPEEDARSDQSYESSHDEEEEIRLELARTWILNLSMCFRDGSPREKFFITYAQAPERWRRVTVSCDYRKMESDSLEAELQETESQREKSARIYESLRGSLNQIQFYDTVTNLKLETRDQRLHVHVTEDLNEIIKYPPIRTVQHLDYVEKFRESEISFVEHMSGFVYKVNVRGEVWVKKEIPGPESVDEFLYEVNALSKLIQQPNVIDIKGLVVSEDGSQVKGLLIAYAEKNALIDVIYDNQKKLSWARRERWSRQIIAGLNGIHEAGFVQGDFTLSNIVIDENDDAQIIDINRRGCPIGWEPPEIAGLIAAGQRIAMFIGIKSDLFQLGMVLWAVAMKTDEPERHKRPLKLVHGQQNDSPPYFQALVNKCLDEDPVKRPAAKELLEEIPASVLTVDLDVEDFPELEPATIYHSVPVVNGDPRKHFDGVPETSKSKTDKVHHGEDLSESLVEQSNETNTLDQDIETAQSLHDPHHHSTGNHIRDARDGSNSKESLTQVPDQTKWPDTSNHQNSSRYPASSADTGPGRHYHDGSNTITLDTTQAGHPAWSPTLDDPLSPYEVPTAALSPIDEPSIEPPSSTAISSQPAATGSNPRRSHNSSVSPGSPSPPPHVDSGLADIDTPRASMDQQQQNSQEIDLCDGDENLTSRALAHVDSGFGNDNFLTGHAGLNERLSFRDRVRHSQGYGAGMDEELTTMLRNH